LALFAGVLASLAQTVAGNVDVDESPASWKALRVFLYSAIMLNLSGAFVSLMMVKLCSDFPLAAYQNADQGKPLETGKTISELLRACHVSRWYWYVNQSFVVTSFLACLCTFTSFSFWVLLSETFAVGVVTMVIFSILAINAILVFAATKNAQVWT
jgi:hypothetical protein